MLHKFISSIQSLASKIYIPSKYIVTVDVFCKTAHRVLPTRGLLHEHSAQMLTPTTELVPRRNGLPNQSTGLHLGHQLCTICALM
jgi:hypothetical protein